MIGVSNVTNRMDPNSIRSRVFVGNLNTLHIQNEDLESIFSKYGNVIGISVHKGFAFIQYSNEFHARSAACGEDGNTYYGMKLDVTIASEPKNRKRGRSAVAPAILNQSNIMDMAQQTQALAVIGGQFSHLGFMHDNTSSIFGCPSLTQPQPPPVPVSSRLCRSASLHQQNSSSSSAKRTRLEGSLVGPPPSTSKRYHGKQLSVDRASMGSLLKPHSGTSAAVISDKLSGIQVGGSFYPRSDNAVAPTPPSKRTLLCQKCERAFASVDLLKEHKANGCPFPPSRSYSGATQCRCKMGEPTLLDCAYCGDTFLGAWELMSHCHSEHSLTIYAVHPTNGNAQSPLTSSSTPPPRDSLSSHSPRENGGWLHRQGTLSTHAEYDDCSSDDDGEREDEVAVAEKEEYDEMEDAITL